MYSSWNSLKIVPSEVNLEEITAHMAAKTAASVPSVCIAFHRAL